MQGQAAVAKASWYKLLAHARQPLAEKDLVRNAGRRFRLWRSWVSLVISGRARACDHTAWSRALRALGVHDRDSGPLQQAANGLRPRARMRYGRHRTHASTAQSLRQPRMFGTSPGKDPAMRASACQAPMRPVHACEHVSRTEA